MKIHFIEHVLFEYPGYLLDWADAKQHTVGYTKIFEDAGFPPVNSFDVLIILGGPMGVYEENEYDWLKPEKAFIKQAILAGKKVLGICLGCQLIAEVLGAKVAAHTVKEIGWWPVQKVNEHALTKALPNILIVFHWHGDTYNLPEGALQLFSSEACEQQGFVYGNNVAALQFHMETKEDLLRGITEHERSELTPSTFVQSEKMIYENIDQYVHQQNNYLRLFMNAFMEL